MAKLFLITASYDEGIMYHWHFFANNKLDVAEYVIDNFWNYEKLFRNLFLDIQRDRITPRRLLERIESSNIDGGSQMGFKIFEIEFDNITSVANEEKKSLLFSEISYEQIKKIVKLKHNRNDDFLLEDFEYQFSKEDDIFFEKMLNSRFDFYETHELLEYKIKLIYPLLEMINFEVNDKVIISYGENIVANFNNISLGGNFDFLVAKGKSFYRKNPIFILNQYTSSESHPDMQVVLRMLVAMQNKEISSLIGVSIHRGYWEFIKLEKIEDRYSFTTSDSYSTEKKEDLKSIYKNLQAVKSLYCKEK